jgi:glycerate kinase
VKVLVVPDKFKGTLSAHEAAQAMGRGWRRARPGDELALLPMSDGGDGFGEVMGVLLQARRRRVKTVDAAGRPCRAQWWWIEERRTAIIESAAVIGLAMLPKRRFHPFDLDTAGLGSLLKVVRAKGAKDCVIGIGGSATNDGGFGMACALGWQFLDRAGRSIERWTDLRRLHQVEGPGRAGWFDKLTVAVDVSNPLFGARGATRVYGPQKGLRERDFALAESCLRSLARSVAKSCGSDPATEPGAGAAGGLGFGLRAFAGGRLEGGFDLFARAARLDGRLRKAELVVTGEGRLDASSLMGKGVGRIAELCRELGLPCLALAGSAVLTRTLSRAFIGIHVSGGCASRDAARKRLEALAFRVAKEWNSGLPSWR